MGEYAVVVVLIPAAVQAHPHAEPDLLSCLDCDAIQTSQHVVMTTCYQATT
jgi:hypothetical protein